MTIQSHKISFYLTLGLIFLLPLFFIPGGALSLGVAKSALFILGTVIVALVYVYELWREGRFTMPKSYLLLVVAALPVVYLLSALLATPSSLSLFGYGFEAGTFGFILLASALLVLVAGIYNDTLKIIQALTAFFLSLAILALFVGVKVILGLSTSLEVNNMGNPLGSWTDLGMAFGLLAVFSTITLGIIPMRGLVRGVLYAVFVISTLLLILIGFHTAFAFTLGAAILMYLYFKKIERDFLSIGQEAAEPIGRMRQMGPIILGVVSLIFLINPNVSTDKKLGTVISEAANINNTDVRPSFSATLSISKAVLSQTGLLGSGPNTFGQNWLTHKPRGLNSTPFWGVEFSFGAGFLPTQIATTGILGSALWLAFLVLLVVLAIRALGHIPESRAERFVLVSTLFMSLFLWVAAIFYVPSGVMLLLAFVFAGLFVRSAAHAGAIPTYDISLRSSSQTHLAGVIALLLVVVGAAFVGWTGYNKTVSAYHFNSANSLFNSRGSSFAEVEEALLKAVEASPTDIYFVALSRLNFAKAQAAANATSSPEQNQAIFQDAIARSVEAARLAVSANPASFENWVQLGNIYSALVPKPLEVEGAYEQALAAYSEAVKRNPTNPELYLTLAQLEASKGNLNNALAYAGNSVSLKQDYAEGRYYLGLVLYNLERYVEAASQFEALSKAFPDNAEIKAALEAAKSKAASPNPKP